MIYISAIFFIVIFPIFCNFGAYFYSETKKLYLSLNIFGLKIWGGYVTKDKKGIILKYSDKRERIIPFKKIKTKDDYKILPEMIFYKIHLTASYGGEINFISLYLAFLSSFMSDITRRFLSKTDFIYGVRLKENDENYFNLYLKISFIFNLTVIIKLLLKVISGKIKNGRKK